MPGIARNACCSPCPHGVRRATHCMWSVFVCHGQVQSTGCPWESAGKPLQRQLHSCGILLLWNHTCQAHPFKLGIFIFTAFTAHPYDQFSKSEDTAFTIHCLHHRTQPSQYTVLHRTQPSWYTVLHRTQPSWYTVCIGYGLHGTLST